MYTLSMCTSPTLNIDSLSPLAWTLGLPPPSSMFCIAMWVVVVGRLDVGCVRVVLCIVYLYLTDVSFL